MLEIQRGASRTLYASTWPLSCILAELCCFQHVPMQMLCQVWVLSFEEMSVVRLCPISKYIEILIVFQDVILLGQRVIVINLIVLNFDENLV